MFQEEHNFGKRKGVRYVISATTILFMVFFYWIQIRAIGSAHAEKIEEKVKVERVTVSIINRGAAADTAKKVEKLLSGQKNLKVKIVKDRGANIEQSIVYFREESFRGEAQAIAQLLFEREKIFSYAREASADEEKSADIVIMLGTSKEAPPN